MENKDVKDDPLSQEETRFSQFSAAVDQKNDELIKSMINSLVRRREILNNYFPFIHEGTFLHLVAKRGTIQTAAQLCKLGYDVDIQGRYSETPIFYAIKNSAEMVKFLIEKGADVDFRNVRGETPLHHAVRESAEVVKLLLQNGARVNVVCKRNVSLLHESLHSGSEETVRIILNHILTEILDDYQQVETTEDIMRTIWKNKSKLNIVEKDYPLLVFFAAKVGDDAIFRMVLEDIGQCLNDKNSKATQSDKSFKSKRYVSLIPKDLNFQGYFDRTALHYAVRKQLPEVVEFLVKTGADVNCSTRRGFTPLHYAAGLENKKICKILLTYGANANEENRIIGTPLFQVCGNRNVYNPLKSDDVGYYYEEFVYNNFKEPVFNVEIAKLLFLYSDEPSKPRNSSKLFLNACRHNSLEMLKIFCAFNVHLHIDDSSREQGFCCAALNNCFDIVDFLIEKEEDLRRAEVITNTFLCLINSRPTQCFNMIEYLVARGANVDSLDSFGRHAMYYAIRCSPKLVKLLLKKGAKIKNIIPKFVNLFNETLYSGCKETVLIILNEFLAQVKSQSAKIENTEEIVNTICKFKGLNIIEIDYSLLIFFAAKMGNVRIFRLSVYNVDKSFIENRKYPMGINHKETFGRTALHYAVQKQLPEVVRFLLEEGAYVNCKTIEGATPLHCAAALENEEICKILLSYGAAVNTYFVGRIGTPLDQVCDYSTLKAELLKDDIYGRKFNLFPIETDAFNPKIIKLFLENGADPHVIGSHCSTPFFRILSRGNLELMKIIFQNTAKLQIRHTLRNSFFDQAVQLDFSLEIVDFMLEKGMNIGLANYTPLGVKREENFQYLVDHKANFHMRNNSKRLSTTLSSNRIELLLELGADSFLLSEIEFPFFLFIRSFEENYKILISFIELRKNKLHAYREPYCGTEGFYPIKKIVTDYFENCRLQVEELKMRKVFEGSTTSFYVFLTGSFYNAVQAFKNENLKKYFRLGKYKVEFPCYEFLLKRRFERVLALSDAVNRTEIFLTKHFVILPNTAIREILNCLHSSDFRRFGKILPQEQSFVKEKAIRNLQFNKIYRSRLVEIQEDGILVSLLPGNVVGFVPNSEMNLFNSYRRALDLKVGDVILVQYLGRYPGSEIIRLAVIGTSEYSVFEKLINKV